MPKRNAGIQRFAVAKQIDPQYAALFEQAKNVGVKVLAYKAQIELVLGKPISMNLQFSCEI